MTAITKSHAAGGCNVLGDVGFVIWGSASCESGWLSTTTQHHAAQSPPKTAEQQPVPKKPEYQAPRSSQPRNSSAPRRKKSGIKASSPPPRSLTESSEPWPRRALGFGGVRHSLAGNYGWKKAGAARPGRGKNASRPPFICTPPAAACRSLFLSLRIKAKPFLRLPLMPAAPASRGHGGAAAGHDPAVVDFRRGEPGIVRAGVESWQVSHAEEDQPWLTLGVGITDPL